jgi:PAS domain S-box-containing protein
MMLGIAIWALSYGLELSSTTLEQMLFWINVEYFGISFLPVFWLFFLLKFTGNDKWLNPKYLYSFLLVPIITLLMVWTNEHHHFYYKSVALDNSGDFPLLSLVTGPWYTIHTIYFYTLLVWGVILLINKYRKADQVFRRQNLTILIAVFIPWVTNILYLFGYRPMGHIDSTPFAFIITMLFLSIGLVRFRLLDIIPIARDRVIEAMNEGLIVADNQDRVIDLNQEIRKILLIEEKNIVGKQLSLILPEQTDLFELIKERNGGQIQIKPNNSELILEVSLTPLFENQNAYSGLIILIRDITERVEIENKVRLQSEQLLGMNKLKDRLFSIIAHDLRGPLINLNDIIKMLNEGMISEEEFKLFVPQLSRNIGYTTGLLENLLFWSRSQLQGEVVKPVYFNLKEVSVNILQLFENSINEKEITVGNNIQLSCKVYADKDMIQLVVRNLISNAVKFSKRGGIIKLSASADGSNTILCVTDSGVGISEADQKKLFELETFTTRGTDNEQGTGLGLLLCKDFIEKNGGIIWVESELGKGSKFCVRIPNTNW